MWEANLPQSCAAIVPGFGPLPLCNAREKGRPYCRQVRGDYKKP